MVNVNDTMEILIHPLQNGANNIDSSNTNEDDLIMRDITYLMLKHSVPSSFYHELCIRFKYMILQGLKTYKMFQ